MALWDITGKGLQRTRLRCCLEVASFRDKIRLYADTTESDDPKVYAQRMKERKEGMGLTWLKMDLGVEMVCEHSRHGHQSYRPKSMGSKSAASSSARNGSHRQRHCNARNNIVARRCATLVGMEIPLSMDHLGPSWREVHHPTRQGI